MTKKRFMQITGISRYKTDRIFGDAEKYGLMKHTAILTVYYLQKIKQLQFFIHRGRQIRVILSLTALHLQDAKRFMDVVFRSLLCPTALKVSGSLLLMKISIWLTNFNNRVFDFVKYCGKESMAILIFHIPIIAVAYNFTVAINPKNAEIVIINTCGFIGSAKEEAINTIIRNIANLYKTLLFNLQLVKSLKSLPLSQIAGKE